MSSSKLLWVFGTAFVFLQLINGISAWGSHGHYTTCKIAQGFLTDEALSAVKSLLPDSAKGELANVCSWPDLFDVRVHRYWSKALHYADTPDNKCNYNFCRDCHDFSGREGRCVTRAIYNYTQQLLTFCEETPSEIKYNLTEAIMFLSHFMGDVHQPLHCGFLGDLGGNKIQLHWYGKKANLHHVWDSEIIDTATKKFYDRKLDNMIEALQKNITGKWKRYRKSWETCEDNNPVCPNPYAAESAKLACKYAYKGATPDTTLEDDYFLSRLPVVEKRLAQGAVRLAATLNRIFDSCELSSNRRIGGRKQLPRADLSNRSIRSGSSHSQNGSYLGSTGEMFDFVPKCSVRG